LADWLQRHRVQALIVDPFGAIFRGEENSNSEVGEFLRRLDQIKQWAEVHDLFMTAHTGRAAAAPGAERARGATRLDDWADVRWTYTKLDASAGRYLACSGRDVDHPEFEIDFDSATRQLSFGTARDRREVIADDRVSEVVDAVRITPGLNKRALIHAISGEKGDRPSFIDAAISRRLIVAKKEGNSLLHFLPEDVIGEFS
jgi:hypothetical protein